ncbi:DEAD/DEAH box helicase family protein [Breznakia pachnodae]|uniref:Superfamily II DNA or RNA helicase n=1 Tax=Breznakia pachnodae TaxID=265178 RepID=A0ABU0DXK8_9FIRM|nr:DEAD/DEAH box helicase family protein [Breznakia pachnodae]MDQ0359321.1 superfamily II DNA or RNA helicase [Breznakia pachnodae]
MYTDILNFKGEWRIYQKRVLDNLDKHLRDDKIHIVAAPGSGKTTLGIEIIKRLGQPCLILTPNITIREQWLSRVKEGFLTSSTNSDEVLSNTICSPKLITSITYQAMHSSISKVKDDDEDYSDLDILGVIEKHNIKVICLDEAHHLKNEWWKALEKLVDSGKGVTLLSLTATPPYDSSFQEWNRYIDMCGPIDEEVFTPELVKEGSLCAHQDYVYFNWPTKDEKEMVDKHKDNIIACMRELLDLNSLESLICTHPALRDPSPYIDYFLENPTYLVSLMIYLKGKGIAYPKEFNEVFDMKTFELPMMSGKYLQCLIQNVLYDDIEHYQDTNDTRKLIEKILRTHSCIHRNKVSFVKNDKVEKLLVNSKGKLNSIQTIVKEEYSQMNDSLRMLILCDYIKKEMISLVGQEHGISELGAVPIFDCIYSLKLKGLKLAILSGGIVVIPKECESLLSSGLSQHGYSASYSKLGIDDYVQVSTNADNGTLVRCVTHLFEQGHIHVLTGTKSLLGEGWDSPCINTLILASYVGSFVLSNQMRGRAIRSYDKDSNKVSNIWHLVCMDPVSKNKEFTLEEHVSADFDTLKRRFESFLGLHYELDVVESGFGRITYVTPPYKEKNIKDINSQMLQESRKRDKQKKRWDHALAVIDQKSPVEQVVSVDNEQFEKIYAFANTWALWIGMIVSMIVLAPVYAMRGSVGSLSMTMSFYFLIYIIFAFISMYLVSFITIKLSPQRNLQRIGDAILSALQDAGYVSSRTLKVRIRKTPLAECVIIYLDGGEAKDKNLFTTCLKEFFAMIENQRYMIVRKGRMNSINKYFAVPEIFSKNKKDAQLFEEHIKRLMGRHELVYTRNGSGRKVLLKARAKCFGYRNQAMLEDKKQVLGNLE